jgi:STE24 endopeptidase
MNEDKAARYHRLRRRAGLLSLALSVALLAAVVGTGWSIALRDLAGEIPRRLGFPRFLIPSAAVATFVLLLGTLNELLTFPLDLYRGFTLEHRYGLSTERAGHWLADRGKAMGLGLVFAVAGTGAMYVLIRHWPHWWWLGAAAGLSLVTIALTNLGPVLLLPLFYPFKPLDREALRARLVDLASRAGVAVVDVYEWQVSSRSRKANAALTGLGPTRRILVSDTLLAGYPEEEIEVVLAHELGHHVRHDLWRGIGVEALVSVVGFFVADRLLRALAPAAGLAGIADVAGLPVLGLGFGGVSLAAAPVANALSRLHERRADRFALDLTRHPDAFVSAMRRLGAQNLAEECPSRLTRALFHSHPTIPERIAAARAWAAAFRSSS